MRRARISKCIDLEDPKDGCWTILVQEQKGKPYNISVTRGDKKLYLTTDKNEAIKDVKMMNSRFKAQAKEVQS